ncbi:MAG TPA: TaqI-like C-terminal specificity domain-containing protein [Flavobacteriaceae bacterium]|nr:TaqI-like C-terminal specificity domain-containing protein [Flavobacteriaceae bacterium]
MLTNTKFLSLVNLDERVFETGQVDVAILIATLNQSAGVSAKIFRNRDSFLSGQYEEINQKTYLDKNKNYEIRANLKLKELQLIDLIDDCKYTLDDFLDLPRGIEIGGNSELIKREKSHSSDVPLLIGKNIARYRINFDNMFIRYSDDDKSNFKDRHIFETPKLLIQRIRNLSLKQRIVATLDQQNYFCTNTLRIGLPKKGFNINTLKYLLAIINSDTVNFYFSRLFLNKDIYAYQLQRIPIPSFKEEKFFLEIIDMQLYDYKKLFDEVINYLVYEIYFEDLINTEESALSKFIKKDLDAIIPNASFDSLKNFEKQDVINQLHGRWSDPANEVRKRINSFPKKSPDILKPILEG